MKEERPPPRSLCSSSWSGLPPLQIPCTTPQAGAWLTFWGKKKKLLISTPCPYAGTFSSPFSPAQTSTKNSGLGSLDLQSGEGEVMLINIFIPGEGFQGWQHSISLQQETSPSNLDGFLSRNRLRSVNGLVDAPGTLSAATFTTPHPPPPSKKHALSPVEAQCFLFNLTQSSAILWWVCLSCLCLPKVKEKSQLHVSVTESTLQPSPSLPLDTPTPH